MFKKLCLTASLLALVPTGFAHAGEGVYISGSIGAVNQSSSDNEGVTGAFTTGDIGDGSTIDVAAGTDYGWNTEFDGGEAFALELGKRYSNGVRLGLEYVNTSADVDTHTGVTLGGGAIGALDAAAIAGAPEPLGVTIADVVADGQGDLKQSAVFLNAYYDFNSGGMLQPYLGAGVGFSDVKVDYMPSAIQVIDDSETKFAYQGKAGVTIAFDSPLELFGEVAYRATSDVETDNVLFTGTLDIENKQTSFSAGLRFKFG
jgi:opacity protein-like surface antigen